jgi:sulfate permease, SulP family
MRRPVSGDLSGAVADLGTFVPLVAALILVNGMRPGPLLLVAGVLSLLSGLWFRIPFPVQPLKALTALAVAQQLAPEVIHAAGLLIGLILILLTVTGLADRVARAFTRPVIRSLQLAVGVLLIVTAVRLALTQPEPFVGDLRPATAIGLMALTAGIVASAVWRRWYAAMSALVAIGAIAVWVMARPELGPVELSIPVLGIPPLSVWGTAFVLLVIPQLPLTYGNAVVGMAALAREQFPNATRVRPGSVALSCGIGNVSAALLGGMPMCHGSSGFTAHVRLGARTSMMNVLLGGTFILLGVVFSGQVLVLFGSLPVWALAGFLAYAGLRHALLVFDLRGASLVIAALAAAAGIMTGNLAVTTVIALAGAWGPTLWRRWSRWRGGRRRRPAHPREASPRVDAAHTA